MAEEIVMFMRGRPKGFPPIKVVLPASHNPTLDTTVHEVEDVDVSPDGAEIFLLLSDGKIHKFLAHQKVYRP